MLKKIIIVLFLHLVCVMYIFAQLRAFNDIFPDLSRDKRSEIFEGNDFVKIFQKTNMADIKSGNISAVGIDPVIINTVLGVNPGYLVESISVIPGNPEEITLLDVYNSLGNIRGLKGRLYSSFTKKQYVPLFEDATRIMSERKTTPIPDPSPAGLVPPAETVFIRLKDVNFGNSYYRGEIRLVQKGLCYTLTNFKSLTYFFVPVIKEEKFIAQLYFEPIAEGILIYALGGVDVSDFVASRLDMASAISKRLAVIIGWVAEEITAKGAAKHGT